MTHNPRIHIEPPPRGGRGKPRAEGPSAEALMAAARAHHARYADGTPVRTTFESPSLFPVAGQHDVVEDLQQAAKRALPDGRNMDHAALVMALMLIGRLRVELAAVQEMVAAAAEAAEAAERAK